MAKISDGGSVTMSFSKGMDRASSPIFLESIKEALTTFPFVQTNLTLGVNVIDDNLGFLTKRPGTTHFLDNPDSQPVLGIFAYTSLLEQNYLFRNSGSNWYMYDWTSSGVTWGSPVYITAASNLKPSVDYLGGFMVIADGVDPLLYANENGFFPITDGTLFTNTQPIATGDTNIYYDTTIYPPEDAMRDFLPYGFLQVGNEYIQYLGIDYVNGIFTGCVRGYAGTTAGSYPAGTTIGITYGGYAPPNPSFCVQWNGRIYTCDTSGRLIWSAALGEVTDAFNFFSNPLDGNGDESWASALYISPNDNDTVTSLDIVDNRLIITKYRHQYMVVPDVIGVPYQIVPVSTVYGTSSHSSMAQIDNYLFYFNPQGILAYDGTKPYLMSKAIQDLVRNIPSVNYTVISGEQYYYKYYLAIGQTHASERFGGATYSNAVIVYNYLTQNVFLYQYPYTVNSINNCFGQDGISERLYLGDTSGQVYVEDNTDEIFSDDGLPISLTIQTRFLLFNVTDKTKEYGKYTISGENMDNGSVSFAFLGDNEVTDYDYAIPLSKYFIRDWMPGDVSSYYRGVSYLISESSTARFMIEAIVQDFALTGKDGKR